MIEIDDKIVSADLLREYFACDLAACKGICCVEGNAGAPLEMVHLSAAISRLQQPVCWQTASMVRTPSMVILRAISISSASTHEMQPTTA